MPIFFGGALIGALIGGGSFGPLNGGLCSQPGARVPSVQIARLAASPALAKDPCHACVNPLVENFAAFSAVQVPR